MNVEGAVPAGLEQRLRQDQPVRRDHQGVGSRRPYALDFDRVLQARRLKHLDAAFGSQTLDRTRDRAQPAPCGPIRLG